MRHFRSALLLLGLVLFTGSHAVEAIEISGSDLLSPEIREALLAGFTEVGLDADLNLSGTLLGLEDFKEGNADASILAIPGDAPGDLPGRLFPVGFQVVAFAVHSTNPVRELTYEQLVNLFGNNGLSDNWSDLTTEMEWQDRKISLWANRSDRTIALEIFNATVLHGAALKQSVRYQSGGGDELISSILEDPSALVMVPAIPSHPAVRFLAIKESIEQQAYTPSGDNVFFGDYPLRLPFYLVVSDSLDAETIAKLVQVIYSPALTAALEASYYIPVSEGERRSLLSLFE